MNESRKVSNEAYESTAEIRPTIQAKILRLLAERPRTDDELEVCLEMRHQSVSACRRSLVKSGHVEATRDKRKTRSGRFAQVWRVVQ